MRHLEQVNGVTRRDPGRTGDTEICRVFIDWGGCSAVDYCGSDVAGCASDDFCHLDY